MNSLRTWTWVIFFCLTGSASAGLLDFHAPVDLKLPVALEPLTDGDSGWRRIRDTWSLDGGQTGILEVPAWWQGNRPPRGELVVLEVDYLDDFSRPVHAQVYSGLGTASPYSELHRFGGLDDGTWKTVRIPASSDFIFRFEPSGSLRFRLVPQSEELRVRAFRLTEPLSNEEELYNAATRTWVEREQQRAEIASRYYELAQVPVIPEGWGARPLVPYLRNWMNLIRPISAPQAGEVGAPAGIRMFLNEYESVQLGIYANGADLRDVVVSAEHFEDDSGSVVAEVMVRVAEYSKVKGQMIPGFLVEPFPQRLWPAYPFDVQAGRSHLVWLVVKTSEERSRAGRYSTRIRIKARGLKEVFVPFEIQILDLRLLTMEEADLKLGGCTRGLVPEFELDFLREYNHNMVNIWYASVRPVLSRQGDGFGMEFRLMDDWMAAARRQGITDLVYFLGGNPYGFPTTMHLPRTLAAIMLGIDDEGWRRMVYENPDLVPRPVSEMVVEWARRFSEHARDNDWPNVVLTPFDEPAKYVQYRSDLGMLSFIKPQFKRQIQLLRTGSPKSQIYGSIHHYDPGMDFLEDVDIFCTNAVDENLDLPDEVRRAGKILWEYSGTQDKGLPAVARFTFGFLFASRDSRGSLVWAYNWGNRFDTLDGSNWLYAWNTPFDVIPTPYLEGLREAWDDRRLIETVRKRAREKGLDLAAFFGRLFGEVSLAQGEGGSNTEDDFWEAAKEDLIMDAWRDRLVAVLEQLSD